MNITFLIGNGFDLNLGMKTKYSHFLNVYRKVKETDTASIRLFKNNILENTELWSSAESAFGQYTKERPAENWNADDYCDCHEDFCVSLAEYLEHEELRIDYKLQKDTIASAFAASIKNCHRGLRELPAAEVNAVISNFNSQGFTYNFLVFNYTKTVDNCIAAVRSKKDLLGSRKLPNIILNNQFGKTIHVHGYTDRDMVLGVNDESQISDLSLFAQRGEEYLNQIIKVKTNEMNEENTDRKAHELLAKSDLLYIYGMSIGETDALWWQRVCELLHSKKALHVIIQQHDSPANHILQRRFVTFQNQIRDRIVSFWGGDLDQKNAIKKRIHVDRINIFSQLENLVKETDSEEENSSHAS